MLRDQLLVCYGLLSKGLAELVFLLFGQVGLNDLELLALDRLNNPVNHGPTCQEEQGRGPWRDLGAHRVDEVLVNPIMRKVSGECACRGTYRHTEERDKEEQAEQHAPECTTQCTSPGHVFDLSGLGLSGSKRPGDDGPILNLDELLLLQVLQRREHRLG